MRRRLLDTTDKHRLLDRIECLDDHQLDRIESFVFGMEEQRKRITGIKRMRRLLARIKAAWGKHARRC
jgi:hypothetical protein